MEIDIASDGHVHTRFCHHARGEMEEYVQAALAAGLAELVFLEHLECGINYPESTWLSAGDFQRYHAEGRRLQERYAGRLRIGLGVEVGFNPRALPELHAFLRHYQWDRIGVSYHYYEIAGRHYNVVSRRQENLQPLAAHGLDRVIDDYFVILRQAVLSLPGTVLCHLDAVLRHHPEVSFLPRHREGVRGVLAAVRAKNMALEVNTAGFAQRGEPYPARWIIAEAVALGIPLRAGSDAHRPEEVGRGFAQLAETGMGSDAP
jgi:histidinol-phosphatase (PHP family)